MNKWNALGMLFVLLFASGIAAAPQLQNYTLTPSSVKPGTAGTINIQIYNPSSTEYISGAEIQGTASQFQFSGGVSLGDIGTLGTSIAAIPFSVPQDASPGNYVVTLTMAYYTNLGGTASGYKKFSIPVSISSTLLLDLQEVKVSKSSIQPGDSFYIDGILVNKGGSLRNIILSAPADGKFALDGANKISVGNLDTGANVSLHIPLVAQSKITSGYYSIPLVMTYDDAVSTAKNDELLVGPVTASSEASRVAVSTQTKTVSPGNTEAFTVIIKNTGSEPLSEVHVRIPEDSVFFVPLDYSEKVISEIAPGQEKTVSFEIGIDTNAILKAYSVPLTVTYRGKTFGSEEVVKNVGVRVSGKPDLSIIASTTPAPISPNGQQYKLAVQVSNEGNTPVRAVSVYVASEVLEFLGTPQDYLGTLNLDDYSTSQYPVLVKTGTQPGTYDINVKLTYKDAYNVEYTENHKATIDIVSLDVANQAKGPAASNPLVTLAIIVVIIVAAYFGYKRFFKKKKATGA